MNPQQLLAHQQAQAAQAEKEAAAAKSHSLYCAPGFSAAFYQRPGMARRRSLVALFQRFPLLRLPVNNKWQASTARDPDLQRLIKQGVLVQVREGGGRRHPKNRSSGKRQSYLMLASSALAA
ncbi:hypothetical protein P5X00_36825 [Paraburkholderia sp. A2RO-4L]|uniref:hypothetical protein n=1 Tax=Paraburkholderia sp. A2RO-4L TaxID=3028374 RepID=UPI003DA9754D